MKGLTSSSATEASSSSHRRFWKTFSLLLAAFLMSLPVAVQGQFNYVTNEDTITITGYTGPGGDVTVPNTINGLPVTSIGASAFYQSSLTSLAIPDSVTTIGYAAFHSCSALTSLAVPNGVTFIGDLAFYGCTSLASVLFSESVTSIGSSAFGNCSSLTSISIPHSVTNVGDSPFGNCKNLLAISVDALNSNLSSWNGVLFNKDQTTLIQCPTGITGDFMIPNSVRRILHWAFYGCGNLTNVTIGENVGRIENFAFSGCTNLVITVNPLNSDYTVQDAVIFNRAQTELVLCPEGKSGSYAIPSGVIRIGAFAFYACGSLTNVMIANSVTSIGATAFRLCTSLTSVLIPNSVTNIGNASFYQCDSLTSVTIPNSVTALGSLAFGACAKLHSVYFLGNAPGSGGSWTFSTPTVYYLPGTTGWGATFAGRPTALWHLSTPLILNTGPAFGVRSNAFGFRVSWATNIPVVIEASTDPSASVWSPVSTNTLANGWFYFSDPEWTNYPSRIYRVRRR